jgi:hypothetical protein
MKLTDNILAFRARHHADSEQAQPTAAIVSRLGSADPARVVGVVAAALCNIVWVYKLRGHPAAESPSAETRQGPLTSLTSPALHHFLSIRKRTPRGCVSNTVPLLTSERVATSVFCALRIRVSGDTVSEDLDTQGESAFTHSVRARREHQRTASKERYRSPPKPDSMPPAGQRH